MALAPAQEYTMLYPGHRRTAMCGIAGFVAYRPKETLERMAEAIVHRGPDSGGVFHAPLRDGSSNVGLGHRRLSIIDLETGDQPMFSPDGRYSLIFNGEIYNFKTLRDRLAGQGFAFRTRSDTEVILNGYIRYGAEVVDHLDGMYAFALWDREAECLFIARDRLGIKPLYYAISDGEFFFGSELKAFHFLLSENHDLKINRRALYHFLLHGFPDVQQTLFDAIKSLPPAHTLTWKGGKVSTHRYWQLTYRRSDRSLSGWAQEIRNGLSGAVASHLVSDVPLGIALSGGLDSSAVLAMMATHLKADSIHAYTVGYGLPDDETPYARIASKKFGVTPHEGEFPVQLLSEKLSEFLWHVEEPIAHPGLGTAFLLSKFLRSQVKVVLLGEGSDELFAGYPHFRLLSFPFNLAPPSIRNDYYNQVVRLLPDHRVLGALLKPEWSDADLLHDVAHCYEHYTADGPFSEGAQLREVESRMVGVQLLRVDKLMMAHSIEARVPFLDKSLVELAFTIPFELKVTRANQKAILREAMKDVLPKKIIHRPKSGRGGTQALLGPVSRSTVESDNPRELPALLANGGTFFRKDQLADYISRGRATSRRFHPIKSRQWQKFLLAALYLETWKDVFLKSAQPAD